MKMLMITWTDIFNGTATFFEWIFVGVKAMGQIPNVIIWVLILGVLTYWTMRLSRYKKQSQRNSTLE
jgi:Flp pilus assembly protein TadB